MSRLVKSDCVGWGVQQLCRNLCKRGLRAPETLLEGPVLGEGTGSRAMAWFCWVWATQNITWTSATKAKAVLQHCFRNRAASSSYTGLPRRIHISSAHKLLHQEQRQVQDRTIWKQAQTADFSFWNRDSDCGPLLPCSFQLPASLEGGNAREKNGSQSSVLQGQHWNFYEPTYKTIYWARHWKISCFFSR